MGVTLKDKTTNNNNILRITATNKFDLKAWHLTFNYVNM